MIRKGRGQKLSGHQQMHSLDYVRPTPSRQVRKLMAVSGNEPFRPVTQEQFFGLVFLADGTRKAHRWRVMEDKPSSSSLPSKDISPVEPDRFLSLRTVIRNGRQDQVVYDLRYPVGDNIWLCS